VLSIAKCEILIAFNLMKIGFNHILFIKLTGKYTLHKFTSKAVFSVLTT